MPLSNEDLFVVQRGNSIYKVNSSTLKQEYSSTANVSVGPNPPLNPVQGDLWWSTLEGNLFIWYDENTVGGDSAQWVDASPAFVDIDYSRIFDYLDQSILDNAVASVQVTDELTVSPADGKGNVVIGVDTSQIYNTIELLEDFVNEDQQRQDDEIARLEGIIKDLADRLDQLEDTVAGLTTLDGGYPNAEGVFDEDDTDGGTADPSSMTGTPISGGDAEGYD